MCNWGTTRIVNVKINAGRSSSGHTQWKDKPIDLCISDIVEALQKSGIDMLGSCCGHGQRPGEIVLADGRTLIVLVPEKYVKVGDDQCAKT
jgi:hypothetical protein